MALFLLLWSLTWLTAGVEVLLGNRETCTVLLIQPELGTHPRQLCTFSPVPTNSQVFSPSHSLFSFFSFVYFLLLLAPFQSDVTPVHHGDRLCLQHPTQTSHNHLYLGVFKLLLALRAKTEPSMQLVEPCECILRPSLYRLWVWAEGDIGLTRLGLVS